jgi:hypothetical protein
VTELASLVDLVDLVVDSVVVHGGGYYAAHLVVVPCCDVASRVFAMRSIMPYFGLERRTVYS